MKKARFDEGAWTWIGLLCLPLDAETTIVSTNAVIWR